MLKICGSNESYQLGEKSNNVDVQGDPTISPLSKSPIDANTISSYSTYMDHSVIITTDGKLQCIGTNNDGRILRSLPNQQLKKYIIFDIKDKKGTIWFPNSAVCGTKYTLYMVSQNKNSNKSSLCLSHYKLDSKFPLFLNIGNSNPVALFGGKNNAAAIDAEGSIIFIPDSIYQSTDKKLSPVRLPSNEKAVSVAFIDGYIFSIDLNGEFFKSVTGSDVLEFGSVVELEDVKIVDISGKYKHCLAVADDGRVFGLGSNDVGRIGLSHDIYDVDKFTEITSLKDYKIKAASAGSINSVFLSEDGLILVCGDNRYGQIPGQIPSRNPFYSPSEKKIKGDVKFILSGAATTSIFIDTDPINSPNRRITDQKNTKTPPKGNDKTSKQKSHSSPQPNKQSKKSENYFIDIDEQREFHKVVGQIGEGGTSVTYKVVDKRTKIPMCKKVLKYNDGQSTFKDAKRAMNEFEILYNINHPCICKSIGINVCEPLEIQNKKGEKIEITTISLFLEYLEHSLHEVLKMNISNTFKTRVVLDVAHGMNFIHKKGMIHRDLKIDNIMLNAFFETKIVDFGLVKINESIFNNFSFVEESMTKGVGTLAYMSPEMANEEEYDNKTDVYSFGIVVHFIFTGTIPRQNLKDKLTGKHIKLPSPSKSISPFCIKLISQCLKHSPSDRPSFEQILEMMRKNSFELADDIDPSILERRDKELQFFD